MQMHFSRRTLMAALCGQGLASALDSPESEILNGKHTGMIVHSRRPIDLEARVELLDSWLTPIDRFYVRTHFYTPRIELADWNLKVDGLVDRPLSLGLQDLKRFEPAEVAVTLECAGNGRAFFDPRVLGTQWRRGAVGTARWRGARLRDVLDRAGLQSSARHLAFDGADIQIGNAADFVRSIPREKSLHPDTILAYEMNGQTLPVAHGFPLRLITPGWEGAASVKWLIHISAREDEFDGSFMSRAYRVPKAPVEPGVAVDPADTEVITSLRVKSLITHPVAGSEVPARPTTIRGFAWGGESEVSKVEVSTDGGSHWDQAQLDEQQSPYAWREFTYDWNPASSKATILMVRATDENGNMQSSTPSWNPGGYLRNVIHAVSLGSPVHPRNVLSELPGGPGKEIYEQACSSCHDASPVFQQQHDLAGWRREVEKMERLGTSISSGDKQVLIEYLARNFSL